MPRSLRALVLLAAACGPSANQTDTATGSTTMSEQTGSTSTGDDPTSTSEPTTNTTTGEPGTTSGEPGTTTGEPDTTSGEPDTTTGGFETCEQPDRPAVAATWEINFPNGGKRDSFSADCTVSEVEEVEATAAFVFLCKLDEEVVVQLTYLREPVRPPPLLVGEVVRLEYREELIFWINRWFSIRDADTDTVRFAGVEADHIEPPGATVLEFYGTDLAVLPGLCPPIDGFCGPEERLALSVPFVEPPATVFSGQFAALVNPADYDLWLAIATRPLDPVQCDDIPPAWFQALMTLSVGP